MTNSVYPAWFRGLAVITGIIALFMSAIPVFVYAAMSPRVRSEVIWRVFFEAGLPTLIVYGFALATAILLNPGKRQMAGATLLGATLPVAVLLMIYGLR